jgi:hypothetical protein
LLFQVKKCHANDDEADETANDNNEEEGELWVSYSHKFDAEHHIHHFGSILKAYNQEVKKLLLPFSLTMLQLIARQPSWLVYSIYPVISTLMHWILVSELSEVVISNLVSSRK